MTSLPSPSLNHILLVEGQDDEHVVRHLCRCHGMKLTFSIKSKEGFTKLLSSISSEIKVPERRAVGILVDANDNLQNRWQAVTDQLLKAKIKAPSSPAPTGTIIEGQDERPCVGIWLMPDNRESGELENFVTQMIPTGDPVWPQSQRYIDDIPQAERKFLENKVLRAKLHAWLATRKDPRKMGLAISACDLDDSGPLCQNFLGWLKNLLVENKENVTSLP